MDLGHVILAVALGLANASWLLIHLNYRAAYRDSVKSEHAAIARARRAEQERDAAQGIAAERADGWNRALDTNTRLIKRDVVTRVRARSERRH